MRILSKIKKSQEKVQRQPPTPCSGPNDPESRQGKQKGLIKSANPRKLSARALGPLSTLLVLQRPTHECEARLTSASMTGPAHGIACWCTGHLPGFLANHREMQSL